MHVVLLSKALVVGAYQRKCELIAAHPNIRLTVLVPPAWGNQHLERAHTRGYTLREIPIRFNGNFHVHHYPTLPKILAQLKPNVLHVDEEPYNLATWLALRACSGTATKKIFFSWQNIARSYPPPFCWMERSVLQQADAAQVGNAAAKHVWQDKGFQKNIHVIPQFGVDENIFTPAVHAKKSGTFTIGYVGRLVPEKGIDLVIAACAQLTNAKLVIVGSGPAEQHLRTLAQDKPIQFRPPVPSTHMPNVYREFDALVLPSRTQPNWKEQFGRVLIEAMACGVPVVGSDSGEIPNVIGDAGLTFPEGDAAALAQQLLRLQNNVALRTELAQKGRARVLAKFTMQHIADETVNMYQSL